MASNWSQHRDGERTLNSLEGLGSIHSCLDGVPFKIGPKFKPPEKIHIPPDLLTPKKCTLLEEQYTFETEEGVLAWIRAKEETHRNQKLDAEERRAKELEEFTRAAKSDSSDDEDGDDNFTFDPVSHNTVASNIPKRPVIPNFDSILTPTPIQTSSNPTLLTDNNKTTPIDLSMFEKEKDAFENLDLQAINEMEELKNLFQDTGTSAVKNDITSGSQSEQMNSDSGAKANKPTAKPRKTEGKNTVVSDNIDDDGDYVKLQVDFSQNRVVFNNDNKENINISESSTGASYSGPSNAGQNNIYKSVLPPIHPGQQSNFKTDMAQSSVKQMMNGLNGVNSQTANSFSDQTVYYNLHPSTTLQQTTNISCTNNSQQDSDIYENLPEARLRSARSNPDLSVSPAKRSVSPRFSMSHTPPPIPSRPAENPQYENWDLKKKPVPPIPPVKTILKTTDTTTVRTSTPPETDPYPTLSKQDQIFVNKFCSMGFPRPRISRAVAKLGQDEKQVIDHLCYIDNLIGKGYNPMKSESALFLFGNVDKASSYIDSYSQFQELGFHADKIREALIKTNVDRDKALDELMAS
ncbi:hypothetical protein LOTGIDRAFT_234720 [Lottia gigantea]|uniref:UMA domain-containing protein n=1 Tax=Lottia gigantea TaxID=225164 RepID=V4BHI5_LOTGI|nr:hypothetical protein LOTGIDRAFT_234720 [Lottia gigantea]ESO88159.1 hypothetical protein LOTGIDRAFT_234720 [Lottia gigantea]